MLSASGCMLPIHAHLSREGTPQPGALGRSRRHTDCRSLGREPLAMPGNCFMGSRRRDVRHCGTPQMLPGGTSFGRLACSISHSRPVRGLPLLFGTPQPGALGRSRRHTDAGALGGSLWQCQATVLWDPEGDVPGDVRCDVRHCLADV